MKLTDALAQIALDLDLDPVDLVTYAAEDKVGGWDHNDGPWPIGSVWSNEGKILNAVVRAMRPNTVVEVGVAAGCSSAHILRALVKNRKGKLVSYCLEPKVIKSKFTQAMLKRWELVEGNVLNEHIPEEKIDIVFEDAVRSTEATHLVLSHLALSDPQVVFIHGSENINFGDGRQAGFEKVFGSVRSVAVQDGYPRELWCGLGYKRVKG